MPINYSQYPPNWKTIRQQVLERAKHCCENCGLENHSLIHRYGPGMHDWEYWPDGMESELWDLEGLKCTKIVLTIAHLDHDKENHDVSLDRLRAWCQKCHLGYDMDKHVQKRKETMKKRKGLIEIEFPVN